MLQAGAYLTPDEAAARLDVHSDTIRRWVHTGRLRGYRVGIRIRISPEELERFVREGGADPSSLAESQDAAAVLTA